MDIEGFEEEDDGKPKTPAPVREITTVFFLSFLKTSLPRGKVHDLRMMSFYHFSVFVFLFLFFF